MKLCRACNDSCTRLPIGFIAASTLLLCIPLSARAGDKLEIAWLDNHGERSQSETAIA